MNQLANQNNHLLILSLDDSPGQLAINLNKNVYVIGRHSSCAIKLSGDNISRHHGTLIKKKSALGEYFYLLIDGNLDGKKSQNGIFVNGQQISNHRLENNDEIIFATRENTATFDILPRLRRWEDVKMLWKRTSYFLIFNHNSILKPILFEEQKS